MKADASPYLSGPFDLGFGFFEGLKKTQRPSLVTGASTNQRPASRDASPDNSAADWGVSYHVTKLCHQASARRVLVQDLGVVLADSKLTEPEGAELVNPLTGFSNASAPHPLMVPASSTFLSLWEQKEQTLSVRRVF